MTADTRKRRASLHVEAEPAKPNPEALRARVYEPGWKYVPKAESDIRKTFNRIRRQLKDAEAAAQPPANVKALRTAKKASA